MSNASSGDLYLRPLPYLDAKWLRADLLASLRNVEDAAVLWNHLIQDCELVSSPAAAVVNANGDLSYLGDDGKHYCGAQLLQCACCQTDYCGPLSACNCDGCRPLDSDTAIKKLTAAAQLAANQNVPTDVFFDTWNWSQPPNMQGKKECQRMLVSELHELSLRAAGNCLSAQHLRQQLFIYERYFVALTRSTKKMPKQGAKTGIAIALPTASTTLEGKAVPGVNESGFGVGAQQLRPATINNANDRLISGSSSNAGVSSKLLNGVNSLHATSETAASGGTATGTAAAQRETHERATLGLARVGTRAALNFSFAFLRRAWRSGEDIELCSELLSEALDSLQELPEATLFEATEVSPLWLEVLERSIKFLRLVTLGDPMGGRCIAPLVDRHTALCLLLELGAQKGTLAATLESIVLLLMLWDKEKSTNDNREMPQKTGAPLVPILQRYKRLCKLSNSFANSVASYATSASATETFLRFLMLPRHNAAIVDLKKAAVVIMSHLDRLAKPHLPNGGAAGVSSACDFQAKCAKAKAKAKANQSMTAASSSSTAAAADVGDTPKSTNGNAVAAALQEQRIYALGWHTLAKEQYGFTAEPAINLPLPGVSNASGHYSAPVLNFSCHVKQVACSDELVLLLTQEGRIYTWRIAKPDTEPTPIEELADTQFVSIAAHCEGRHYLAVDNFGNAYAWGSGENGRLGLVDTLPREQPTKIAGLARRVKSVHCGCSYSALITFSGSLYTWGRGTYGRLGHGNSDDKVIPTQVMALDEHEIVDVSLGSGDAHTICATESGLVYAWGDGDYGKLGTGSCNSSLLPVLIETLPRIHRVFACAHFSVALSQDGQMFSWGKSNSLGHDVSLQFEKNTQVYSVPQAVGALKHKQIVDVKLGVSHFLALSSSGEVYGWGRNDYQQLCPVSVSKEPLLRQPMLVTHPTLQVCGIACAADQSIIWSQTTMQGIPTKIPFVIDLHEQTFRLLDQLLGIVCAGGAQDNNNLQTPDQESECIAVACLNLIRLQLVALKANSVDASSVGLPSGSRLLASLKTRILNLSGGMNVLKTIQLAAQWALQDGWSILLPTAAERAQTLTSLLPSEPGCASSGHRFMTDLLVSSLMAEGGLETALNQAICLETIECGDNGHNLPLLHLISRLLSNNAALTQTRLGHHLRMIMRVGCGNVGGVGGIGGMGGMGGNAGGMSAKHDEDAGGLCAERNSPSPSLSLLHRFQRLLLSQIHQARNEDTIGAETLLQQYLHSMVPLCAVTLQKAHEVALQCREGVADIMKSDISDTLLFELLVGLILIKRDRPLCMAKFKWTKLFVPLLHALDNLNRNICDSELQDGDDMGWPGIICRGGLKGVGNNGGIGQQECEAQLIRKIDLENHVLDGGQWVVLSGYVCDIKGYISEAASVNQLLADGLGDDLTTALNTAAYRSCLEYILQHHKVGKYASGSYEEKPPTTQSTLLTHFNAECALSYVLGLVANVMVGGLPLQLAELQCKNLNKSSMLSGGLLLLQPTNPFDEEKGEARSSASTAGNTPTEPPLQHLPHTLPLQHNPNSSIQQRIDNFIASLAEARLNESLVSAWISLTERYCKDNNLIWHQEFSVDHPVQELERLLTAVLIRHQSLGGLVIRTLESELDESSVLAATATQTTAGKTAPPPSQLPQQIAEIVRLVYQSKWSVVRTRQQLNRSYKEVCAPIIERLRFLLYEVRPAISPQQRGLRRLPLLHRLPRFKQLVRRFIVEMRAAKKQLACAKPEDILNVTIQSQNVALKPHQSHESLLLQASADEATTDCQPRDATERECSRVGSIGGSDSIMVIMPPLRQNTSHENLLEGGDNSLYNNAQEQEIKLQATELIYEDKKPEVEDESHVKLRTELMRKLSEKLYFEGELNTTLMHDIVDFAMQDACDVETVRRAMYCQMQRYKIRHSGLEMFQTLLQVHGLLDAAQYSLLNGFLGLHLKNGGGGGGGGAAASLSAASASSGGAAASLNGSVSSSKQCTTFILKNLNMITAYQKANLLLAQSHIIEWAVSEIKRLVNQEQLQVLRGKYSASTGVCVGAANAGVCGVGPTSSGVGKDSTNLGTYVFLKKLPRARFLLSVFGVLAKEFGANELSLIINSGLLGTILGLLAQTGGDIMATRNSFDLTVVYEDTVLKQKSSRANLTGPELAKLMKIGTRIVRGADWKWGDQDGNPPGEGRIISEVGEDGWVRVEWYTGATNSYRMGKEGQYDLQLADSALNVVSPSDTEKETIYCEAQPTSESHPTKLLRYCSTKLLQVISVGSAMHSEFMDKHALRSLTSMFRAILTPNPTMAHNAHNANWISLGFIKAIASDSKTLSRHLSSNTWLNFYMELLEQPSLREHDLFRKIHCLRLLQSVLMHWSNDDANCHNMTELVRMLFELLGKFTLYCPNDFSLVPHEGKSRVLLSASHSGTSAEELITLLRKLHMLPYWNPVINSFLAQKLCVAAELVAEDAVDSFQQHQQQQHHQLQQQQHQQQPQQQQQQQHLDYEYIYVMGVLGTIGGYDIRPRIGLNCFYDTDTMTISGFTSRGKCMLVPNNLNYMGEFCKITLATVLQYADYSVFSLTRLPMNEMLLNAWSVLLFGHGDNRCMAVALPDSIDANVLRMQQLQVAVLNTNCVLYRHQAALRRILKQRAPGICRTYSTEESISEDDEPQQEQQKQQQQQSQQLPQPQQQQQQQPQPQTSVKSDCLLSGGTIRSGVSANANASDNELLVQAILMRATQPSPVKACYSYSDLAIAALNCVQTLASQAYVDLSDGISNASQHYSPACPQLQPTMIHGVPIYNLAEAQDDESATASGENGQGGSRQAATTATKAVTDAQLIGQIMEMGFTRNSVELALKQLTLHPEALPTPEQIVQWILEHPDVCANTIDPTDFQESDLQEPLAVLDDVYEVSIMVQCYRGSNSRARRHDSEADSDNDESLSTSSSSDTVEGSSIQDQPAMVAVLPPLHSHSLAGAGIAGMLSLAQLQGQATASTSGSAANAAALGVASTSSATSASASLPPIKFETRKDFPSADQYALYVRGLVCPGMIVRCCRDFEEIRKGDMGTVLIVDTEGLHDLNVQVDWQLHGNTYWVCFVHIELVEQPREKVLIPRLPYLTHGSRVRLRRSSRMNWTQQMRVGRSIGSVTAIKGKEVTVDFPELSGWQGNMNDVELVSVPTQRSMLPAAQLPTPSDLIDDWSRCIRTLSVSSNETAARHLLYRTANVWQSTSSCQGKHWIRLEMHDHILVHSLTLQVSPDDHSHMPSLVEVRVGECVDSLKEYTWIAIKSNATSVLLMHDVRHYFPWIEIVIKQCQNNGIQCKVHGIQIVGRRKQTDLDLMLMNASFLACEYTDISEPSACYVASSAGATGASTSTAISVSAAAVTAAASVATLATAAAATMATATIAATPATHPAASIATTTSTTITNSGNPITSAGSATMHAPADLKGLANDIPCTVMVWGLNDKEQLGGLKGSKVKVPTISQTISRLRPIHIAGGSKSLFVVSQDGKVYACGEGTNGRLGLGVTHNVSMPHQVPVLHQYVVKKVAVHSGGKHALALTLDGKVFSWGEGEDGKLGHGNRSTMDKPKLIETLRAKKVRDIACGSSHSAAITSAGELYTWGLGEYGRLGHGDNATQLKPKMVIALVGKRVIQVACGSRDAQTLALSEDGTVYSWGDGDFGKLGRGGSEGSAVPHEIERLTGIGVVQIECGAQFSLALTSTGEVWTWGKGDYYRLGHGGDQHVRKPQLIQGLRGRRVIHVAVGALHCLAVTDSGQVYAWGDNDHGQQGSGDTFVNKKPAMVIGLDLVFVNRVACGSSHSIAWGLPNTTVDEEKKGPVPFTSTRDPLGGSSLGIYDAEPLCLTTATVSSLAAGGAGTAAANSTAAAASAANGACGSMAAKPSTGNSLSESILQLETPAARQTALNYVLKAMSIMQARQLIIAALTSHSKVNYNEKQPQEIDGGDYGAGSGVGSGTTGAGTLKDLAASVHVPVQGSVAHTVGQLQTVNGNEVIAQGGGEAPADASDPALHEVSPDSADGVVVPPPAGPLSAFQSLTGSLSMSASYSSSAMPHKHSKMSASAMSVMAATMTNQEEMMEQTSLTGLDDFTSLLGESEAKGLIELLKLSVCGRTGAPSAALTIAETLISLGANSPTIGAMLLETCITELEDLCTSRYCLGKIPKPVMQESSHPYVDNATVTGHVKISGAEMLRLEFDSQCSTEKRNDPLVIMDSAGRVIAMRSGREFAHWAPEIRISGEEMRWKFSSDSSVNGWGWRFWVHAIMPASTLNEHGSDRAVLSAPSIALVMALLDERLGPRNISVLLRLAAALSTCSQLAALTTTQRIWALKKLHVTLLQEHAPKPLDAALNPILLPLIPELLRQYEYEEPQVRGGIHLMHSDYFKTLAALSCDMQLDVVLPSGDVHKWAWFKRYCIAVRVAQALIKRTELPRTFCLEVRKKFSEMLPSPPPPPPPPPSASSSSMSAQQQGPSPVPGQSLMNSTTSLSSSTTSNPTPPPSLSSMAMTSTTAMSMAANSIHVPSTAVLMHYIDSVITMSAHDSGSMFNMQLIGQLPSMHEDHTLFKAPHDAQLLQWLNRRPDDWALSWGGASTIYGWGHNHRGQLGGLEGSRIKTPTPCEALSLLRPVLLAGGEQTLFAVTPDGKLFATGYGSGGRLGVGGTDSWAIPTLIGSLQHVFIKKVAVNSGGKHCLALTTEGEVYSWGEGEDGKLGHDNRVSYDRPKLIEDLNGMAVVDIACGSAHSAAITASGHVLTWGKGSYGRLGHGDSENQLRPKLVEALLGYRAIDIACGSGDAQTLCITDDDNVWSWGDGDYGKLGRGGSDGCKAPYKIESLAGLGVVMVECGSQFSVALTKSGAVYTWGKGDFHRLGHGTVDHVRRPKKVAALQGKKIISIATGSLHCVACSDTGDVYTWGDNDEGQLGDGTVTAIPRPRLVVALQGKHIVKVTCGSAHTLALSTSQLTERLRPLPNPPLEYDLVRDLPPESLHARLILLHHFSELLCPCLAMLPITGELSLGALKEVLVYNIKEAAFRKVIQTTMVRDKQHGPVIELNRIQVKRSRNKCSSGLAGVDGMKSVFGQMVQKLPLLTQEALSLPHRVWKVKFVGESVDDCGGGYSESIAEMCDELQNGSVPLLINTPNGRGEAGANRDCFLLDPTLTSVLQMNMFRFLGVLMGIAVRTGSPLSLNLAEPVWRQLTGEPLRPTDLTEVDRDYVAGLLCIRNMEDDLKVFNTLELPFTTSSAKGHEVPLSTRYMRITPKNRLEYVRLALNFRLHEFDEQVKAVRDGMSKVIPVPLLSLFSAAELQAMVCGSPDIPLGLLKSVATYKGFDPNAPLVIWFWEVMEEFTNQERSLFLRFVWGRTRLPRTIADFRGRDFVLQVLEKNPPDHFLPESYTCFFLLKMPRYSCKAVLLEKLKYAIHFCKSIDTDEYARVAMGEPTEITGSEDNSDIESVASHDN